MGDPAPEAETPGTAQDDDLRPNEVALLSAALLKVKADGTLLHSIDYACFKELLVSWGANLPEKAGTEGGGVSSPGKPGAAVAQSEGAVLELESDEEVILDEEMGLPKGQVDDELADEPEKSDDSGKQEEDAERLPKDPPPYPRLPPIGNVEPSDARKKVLNKVKLQAAEALKAGDVGLAIDRYTEAIRQGGATGLMLSTRGALLLKQRRPCAAIRDCCAALALNPDCGKAFHVRGVAHRKLGHWKKAHRDLSSGQRLDFSEDSVAVHMFVANKVGVLQDEKTGSWYGSAEGAAQGAKKAVEMMYNQAKGETENKKKRTGPVADLRPGQAVRIGGLLKAPQLNGKRGIVQRLNPNDHERWEVELRLERGQVDIKSIRAENIVTVKKSDSQAWQAEEAVFAEARKGRQRDEKRWKEEEDKRKRMDQLKRQTAMDGFPTMDESEQLEAEMSCLLLDEESMALLRRLKAKEALDMLQQASLGGVSDLSRVMKVKARQKLGEAAPAPPNMAPPTMAPPTMAPPTMSPPTMSPPAYPPAAAAAAVEEASVDSDSSDEDFDHLEEETEAPPDRGSVEEEPTEEQQANHGRWKAEAVEALEAGDVSLALERYSQVIANGGATALLLTKRGELLLKQRRPLAAIGDCAAALEQNPDLGKAYRIRGIAHRKLGHWRDAQRDLVEGQRLDYDDGTAAVQKFVTEKARREEERAARAARKRQRRE